MEEKEIKFICPICNREFNKWAGLSKHVTRTEKESGITKEVSKRLSRFE